MKRILLKSLVLLCALVVGSQCGWAANAATNLPFTYTGGRPSNVDGFTHEGLSSDYNSAPKMKFDTTGDYATLRFNAKPGELSFDIKLNGTAHEDNTFTVSTSTDGTSFTTLKTYSGISGIPTSKKTYTIEENEFPSNTRYIRWTYTNKSSGNIGLGNINLALGSPDFSLESGIYSGAQTLTISTASGYKLKYTTDGSDPKDADLINSNTTDVNIDASMTVRAVAVNGTKYSAESSASYTINSLSDPHATLDTNNLAFGDVEVGQTKNMTFTITPANLTGNLAISCDNDKYTLSSTSIPQATTTAQTITVTAAPTALNDNMDGEITISGGGITSQTVSLSATPYQVANVTLVATDNKGTFKQGDNVVTSITSRVGSSATVKAIPVDGYVFDSWSATGATPASSTDAETEFTFTSTIPTLTATFVVDPKVYFTLDGNDMQNMSNAGKSYGQSNLKTITVDGLHWEADAYQDGSNNITNMLQLRIRTNSKGVSYIKLPQFSGNIKKISFSVTGSSDSDTSLNGGNATATVLNFQTGETSNETVVASSSSASSKSKEIDLSSIATDYTTGYITAGGGVRIWSLTVAIEPTDINVSVTSAKYATFSDHVARDFSTSGITVLKAVPDNNGKVDLEEITDGIVPANEGVVLFSDDEVNAAIPATKATGTGDFSDNEMVANVVKTWITDDGGSSKVNYILSNGTNGVGFYKAKAAGANLAAHRAYLSTAATAGARDYLEFSFGETTAITKVENTKQNVEGYYNLNGQRIANPTKGLYIVNGKKVVIK